MNKVIIAYASLSGNTAEVAELIKKNLQEVGVASDLFLIDGMTDPPAVEEYDALIIGTYTWDYGSNPGEILDFVADLDYKPEPTYVFGTGDTQFGGDELYCRAAMRLSNFYNSVVAPLKIEQSPRGSQEQLVRNWTKEVLNKERAI